MSYNLTDDYHHDELNYLNTLKDVISNAKERHDRTGEEQYLILDAMLDIIFLDHFHL